MKFFIAITFLVAVVVASPIADNVAATMKTLANGDVTGKLVNSALADIKDILGPDAKQVSRADLEETLHHLVNGVQRLAGRTVDSTGETPEIRENVNEVLLNLFSASPTK